MFVFDKLNFERLTLVAIVSTVPMMAALMVVAPLRSTVVAPTAVFGMSVPKLVAADHRTTAPKMSIQAAPVTPVQMAKIRPLVMTAPVAKAKVAKRLTTQALTARFESLGYDLDRVRANKQQVPRLFLASLPGDIAALREVNLRKATFFKTILPLVLQVNEEILADRKRLWRIQYEQNLGRKLDALDSLWLAGMADRYRTGRDDIHGLLAKVDVIPPSLALAQAAEESGWGTSRFARQGNALFGQWTFGSGKGIVPKGRDAGKTHRIKAFDHLIDAVRGYAFNLNTHRAYNRLRQVRAKMRAAGGGISGHAMTATLDRYSERGQDYVKTLRTIMRANGLDAFDRARLAQGKSIALDGPSI